MSILEWELSKHLLYEKMRGLIAESKKSHRQMLGTLVYKAELRLTVGIQVINSAHY